MSKRTEDVYARLQLDKLNKGIHVKHPFYEQEGPFLVKDLAERWLLDIKDILKASVYTRYHNYVEQYILPYVGNMRAIVFDKTALSAMLALLRAGHSQKEPLSQYMVYFVDSMMRDMFRYGAEKHLVPEIYFGKSEYKIQSKKYAMPLTELEVIRLVHVIEQQELDFQVQIMLPLYTGISLSELCGLKWKDIDIKRDKIHIRRKLMRTQNKTNKSNNSKNSSMINSGKSKKTIIIEYQLPESSCRDFIMPEKISALLNAIKIMKNPTDERYVAEIEKKKDKTNMVSAKIPEVETDAQLLPPDAKTLQRRIKTIGEQVGISNLTCQMLRDTFAVMGLHAGGDVYNVACVMGMDANTACERYGLWLVVNDGFMKGIG